MKVCSKCKKELDFSYFWKQKGKKDGYRSNCISCLKSTRLLNNDKIKEAKKIYYEKNKEVIKEKNRLYQKNNRNTINENYKRRTKNDYLFKLKNSIRSLIKTTVRNKGYKKNTKSESILGCSYSFFKEYIQNQFKDGMNWDNYGKWELDHIYPISLAKDEFEIYKYNHYTNFQPLWSYENKIKSNKLC
jgi:hypothetical protein